MTLAPYSVCGGTNVGVTPLQATVGTGLTGAAGVSAGSALVAVSSSNQNVLPSGISDSQGNAWAEVFTPPLNGGLYIGMWVALNVTALAAGTDWVEASFASSSGNHELIVRGFPITMTANAIDGSSGAAAKSTSPSSGATAPLLQAAEWAVAGVANGNAGGTPASWTGGFTAVATLGTGPYLTVADQVTTSTAAVTAGATIVNAPWAAGVVTIRLAVPPPPIIIPPLTAAVHRAAWW